MIARRSTRSAAPAAALTVAGLLTALGLVAPRPASAQVYYETEEVDAVLAPRAVLVRLGREGYRAFTHPRFDGDTYVLEADSPWGNRVRLIVDARTGRVIDRDRIEAPLYPPGSIPGGRRPGYGWTEADARALPPGEIGRPPLPRDPAAGMPSAGVPAYGRTPGYGRVEPGYGRPAPLATAPLPEEQRVAARPLPQPERSAPAAVAPRAAPDGNPLGLNPDNQAVRRSESRKTVKTPPKPIESPAALIEPKPKPAAPQPAAESKPVAAASPAPAPTKAADAGWKTPPEAGNRPVRVIGGITPVPGKDEPGTAKE
ncbi:hypothetical protein [Methylobacterium sp. ID0610]|uniref:hypothetical protein n=1 Tax=Methylobacterium carpenticola TaxID=3344827 RepID=UPI0036B902B4